MQKKKNKKKLSIFIYLYVGSIDYRRHKNRDLLPPNQFSTLFADGDSPNDIFTYKSSGKSIDA